ncbi:epoxide hydrolase family protein [Catenuloplanes japonicus]|uniref:epoxide hydrolase family protein n=1 Tax=Catenuloplanes japonicus TaxID=33876 RepID=UPI0005263342|nr:epoxide hydrolase [Catenuloplanes japonicus]
MSKIEPFPIYIPETDLAELEYRLTRVRLPERETDASQGIGLDRLTSLLETWRRHDWRALERRWNAIPHFRSHVDGLDIAFWHVRSPEPGAVPLILTHGWPGSVLEFEDLIGPLTDPVAHGGSATDAFHVVVPALPGFGFSGRPAEQGWNPTRTARAWAEIMTDLGYHRFGAHGGDFGAHVSTELALIAPGRVAGLHLTMPLASPLPEDLATADETEKAKIEKRDRFVRGGMLHVMVQSLRPQTLGYALVDSPVGLAAWLGERLDAFAGTPGVSQERQADNIALYWFTGTGASTARWYWESGPRWGPRGAEAQNAQPVTVPTAFTLFPDEPYPVVRRWAERRYRNIVAWDEMAEGGHFPGWEHPGVLVTELRAAFRHVRNRN